jgi:hypothetical protein
MVVYLSTQTTFLQSAMVQNRKKSDCGMMKMKNEWFPANVLSGQFMGKLVLLLKML